MGISSALGPAHEIALSTGRIRYHDTGTGSPVVFVHGLLVNADIWRGVVPGLVAAGHRCLAPDWPLGSHTIPLPDADLSPTGIADLIADSSTPSTSPMSPSSPTTPAARSPRS